MNTPRRGRPRTNLSPSSTTNRGYRDQHQRRRHDLAPVVAAGVASCAICGQRIKPWERWDLAHADLPDARRIGLYLGPAHIACNRGTADAAKRPSQRPRPRALAFFDTQTLM